MGGKPRKKPERLVGFDFFELPGEERWAVQRSIPSSRAEGFTMKILGAQFSRIVRGPNKGGCKMIITTLYKETPTKEPT